jgi:hypothetical protein
LKETVRESEGRNAKNLIFKTEILKSKYKSNTYKLKKKRKYRWEVKRLQKRRMSDGETEGWWVNRRKGK